MSEDRLSGEITLTEGKYHQIKRMIASLDNRVTFLERICFGEIPLDTKLSRGEWRYLNGEEVAMLLTAANKETSI
jgi:16S rRNA pseudouridine516 synthase